MFFINSNAAIVTSAVRYGNDEIEEGGHVQCSPDLYPRRERRNERNERRRRITRRNEPVHARRVALGPEPGGANRPAVPRAERGGEVGRDGRDDRLVAARDRRCVGAREIAGPRAVFGGHVEAE